MFKSGELSEFDDESGSLVVCLEDLEGHVQTTPLGSDHQAEGTFAKDLKLNTK